MRNQPSERLADIYQKSRRDLTTFVSRMVLRADVAEELVQHRLLMRIIDDVLGA